MLVGKPDLSVVCRLVTEAEARSVGVRLVLLVGVEVVEPEEEPPVGVVVLLQDPNGGVGELLASDGRVVVPLPVRRPRGQVEGVDPLREP